MPELAMSDVPFDILVRSVAEGLRDVYRSQQWEDISPRAEALWSHYAQTTGLGWPDVADRMRCAWTGIAA